MSRPVISAENILKNTLKNSLLAERKKMSPLSNLSESSSLCTNLSESGLSSNSTTLSEDDKRMLDTNEIWTHSAQLLSVFNLNAAFNK